MRLILVRHGQTVQNKAGILQGHTHGQLNETGQIQAVLVGERLKDEPIQYAYVSDLKRARDTADAILKHHPDAKLTVAKQLRELSYGVLDGKPREQRTGEIERAKMPYWEYRPSGGESIIDGQARLKAFYNMLLAKHLGQTVLLVSHGAVLTGLLLHLLGKPYEEYRAHHPKNTAITIVEVDDDKQHKIHILNSIDHLKGMA